MTIAETMTHFQVSPCVDALSYSDREMSGIIERNRGGDMPFWLARLEAQHEGFILKASRFLPGR